MENYDGIFLFPQSVKVQNPNVDKCYTTENMTNTSSLKQLISSVTDCFSTVLECGFLLPLCSAMCFSTLSVLFYFKLLCLCVPTSYLKASALPVAPLPFLPQRSERRLLFCCVPMSFRRKRTRRCCRPRCRASGRTTSGCRRSRRAQWPASSKSPSCCATSTSPVSLTAARTDTPISRKMQNVQHACTLSTFILSIHICKQRHTQILFNLCITTVSVLNLGPACW